MKLSRTLSLKIWKICDERNITPNKLASICCMAQSTIQNIIFERTNNVKLLTILRICEGLNIPVKDFFDDELFSSIDDSLV